jgi:hypothetical protein
MDVAYSEVSSQLAGSKLALNIAWRTHFLGKSAPPEAYSVPGIDFKPLTRSSDGPIP